VRVATTGQLLDINQDAKNEGAKQFAPDRLWDLIDPDPETVHVCVLAVMQDDHRMRTIWMVKMKGTTVPTQVIIDASPEKYGRLPSTEEVLGDDHPQA
jgi:hypothetical protein